MTDPLGRNSRRLAGACLLGFTLLMGATFYWGLLRSEELAARPDNLRRVIADRRTRRGRILDRAHAVLAATTRAGPEGPRRTYPVPAAAPVVGYQTWRYGAGSGAGVTYGSGGAEAAYDSALRGDLGYSIRRLVANEVLHRPRQGFDIVLTLDARLQTFAADQLGEREGAVVVVDVATGAVRALVSLPTFDQQALDKGSYAEDPDRRLMNRATQGVYPPGSVWKAFTLAAALEEQLTSLGSVVDDGDRIEYFDGFPVRCNNNPEGVNRFDIAHAFGWSCNLTFARLGDELGARRFAAYAAKFGLDEAPPFPLPVAAGSLSADDEMSRPELVSAAFGQGEVVVTPLYMALVAAAIASDGAMPVPYLLEDVPGVRHRSIADERGTWRRVMGADTASAVREAMVVATRDGWASSAQQAAGVTLGGKTGTAQVADGAPHAWFIGFAPAASPVLAVSVLVVHGGEGGQVAAPIAGRVLGRALEWEAEGQT